MYVTSRSGTSSSSFLSTSPRDATSTPFNGIFLSSISTYPGVVMRTLKRIDVRRRFWIDKTWTTCFLGLQEVQLGEGAGCLIGRREVDEHRGRVSSGGSRPGLVGVKASLIRERALVSCFTELGNPFVKPCIPLEGVAVHRDCPTKSKLVLPFSQDDLR